MRRTIIVTLVVTAIAVGLSFTLIDPTGISASSTVARATPTTPSTAVSTTALVVTTTEPVTTTAEPTTTEAPVETTVQMSVTTTTEAIPSPAVEPAATEQAAPVEEPAGSYYLDVDITAQQLSEVQNGVVINSMPISSGKDETPTVRGQFVVQRKVPGWDSGPLGDLYFPMYFTGGYAIHGGPLPGYPASHGCVRIPMSEAESLYDRVPKGTPVNVHD